MRPLSRFASRDDAGTAGAGCVYIDPPLVDWRKDRNNAARELAARGEAFGNAAGDCRPIPQRTVGHGLQGQIASGTPAWIVAQSKLGGLPHPGMDTSGSWGRASPIRAARTHTAGRGFADDQADGDRNGAADGDRDRGGHESTGVDGSAQRDRHSTVTMSAKN